MTQKENKKCVWWGRGWGPEMEGTKLVTVDSTS